MTALSLDGHRFAAVANVGGEVGADRVFEYRERNGEGLGDLPRGAVRRGLKVLCCPGSIVGAAVASAGARSAAEAAVTCQVRVHTSTIPCGQ